MRTYIFGTGGSLTSATSRAWDDGVRIVCNTIVKDAQIWEYINPDAIVAGDSIYHFGCSTFAINFRRDLALRLRSSRAFFIYPSCFDSIVQSELGSEFRDQLIPIPIGSQKSVFSTVESSYELPALGNVLNLLLLPLACSISREIRLWGFDGRGPADRDFWKNADRCFYSECIPDLKALHPGFFATHIPAGKEFEYSKSVHGDELDRLLCSAEEEGFTFRMLHETHTATLAKRREN